MRKKEWRIYFQWDWTDWVVGICWNTKYQQFLSLEFGPLDITLEKVAR